MYLSITMGQDAIGTCSKGGAWYRLEVWCVVRARKVLASMGQKDGAWYGPDWWCLVRARRVVPGTGWKVDAWWCLVRAIRVVPGTAWKGGAWYGPMAPGWPFSAKYVGVKKHFPEK